MKAKRWKNIIVLVLVVAKVLVIIVEVVEVVGTSSSSIDSCDLFSINRDSSSSIISSNIINNSQLQEY